MERVSLWLNCGSRSEAPGAYVRNAKIIIIQEEKTTNPTKSVYTRGRDMKEKNCMHIETLRVIMPKKKKSKTKNDLPGLKIWIDFVFVVTEGTMV